MPEGMIDEYPYIHFSMIRSDFRSKGIGACLLKHIEGNIKSDKIFLMVADFNPEAERMYVKNGYIHIGNTPDFYKKGITEHLLMITISKDT